MLIKLLGTDDPIPYQLLLLADETIEAIERYIVKSDVYVISYREIEYAGICCICDIDQQTAEIKNLAVHQSLQSQGIGTAFLTEIKKIVSEKFKVLTVGVADHGYQQMRFYKENGFLQCGVRKDFYIINYPEAIYENDVQLRDMIILSYDLQNNGKK